VPGPDPGGAGDGDPHLSGAGPPGGDGDGPFGDGLPGSDTGPPGGYPAAEPDDVPPLTDADAPDDDGQYEPPGTDDRWDDPDDDYDAGEAEAWPPLPGTLTQIPPVLGGPPRSYPAGLSPPAPGDRDSGTRRPPPGMLDLTLSWRALTGHPAAPARLGRLGPVTPGQALPLAALAASDPAAQWRVILTDPGDRAIAVERVRRGRLCDNPRRAAGVTGRVTVILPAAALGQPSPASAPATGGTGIRAAVLRAARRAAPRAEKTAAADEAAGGCAHTTATTAYRPTTRIREHVEARDQTCRQPYCRQPAWHTDLDHTRAYHRGGPTCPCNIGGHCRTHHKIKQQLGWTLTQPRPGHFEWTTPAGRTYTTEPDTYPT
jgi:hypothetical protein